MTEEQLAGKAALRKKLASLSFSEKVKILERLRDRERVIAAAGLRQDSRLKKARKQETQAEQE